MSKNEIAAKAMEEYFAKFQGLDSSELEKFLNMTAIFAIGGMRGLMGDEYVDGFLQSAIDEPMKVTVEKSRVN